MVRATLGALSSLAVGTAVVLLVLLGQPGAVDAQSHSASRTFQASWASPGSELRVNISASNYGPFGRVVETLPLGFSYVRSSLRSSEVDVKGQTIEFTLFGVSSFYYVVRAPAEEGQYTFSGVITNSDRQERTVAGQTQIRVGPPPTPTPPPTPAAETPPRIRQLPPAQPEESDESSAFPRLAACPVYRPRDRSTYRRIDRLWSPPAVGSRGESTRQSIEGMQKGPQAQGQDQRPLGPGPRPREVLAANQSTTCDGPSSIGGRTGLGTLQFQGEPQAEGSCFRQVRWG